MDYCIADAGCTDPVVASVNGQNVCEYHAQLLCLECPELWHPIEHPHHTQTRIERAAQQAHLDS